MITDRDIVVRAVARGADPGSARVSEWATRELACARPDWDVEDATLSSLALRSREGDAALHAAQEVSRRSARVS